MSSPEPPVRAERLTLTGAFYRYEGAGMLATNGNAAAPAAAVEQSCAAMILAGFVLWYVVISTRLSRMVQYQP
jgi:hypothetical protein